MAIDGVRLNWPSGYLEVDHYLIVPGGRVEFVFTAPSLTVKSAQLVTLYPDLGTHIL